MRRDSTLHARLVRPLKSRLTSDFAFSDSVLRVANNPLNQLLSDWASNTMLNILVAEDDENDFFLLETAFERNGAPVCLRRVSDGQEAIEFLTGLELQVGGSHQFWPDICLVDLRMPRANGFDVIRWVRSRPNLKRIILVVLSAEAQTEDINLAYDLGANSYLTKQASLEGLTARTALLFQYWAECNERPRWNGHACGDGFPAN